MVDVEENTFTLVSFNLWQTFISSTEIKFIKIETL